MSYELLNNKLGIYEYINDTTVRVYGTPDDPYFNGKDVAKSLGYKDTTQAIRTHVDKEDMFLLEQCLDVKNTGVAFRGKTILINQSGLFGLVLKSKKPEAKRFKRWVTSEVLPQIRKTGSYTVQQVKSQFQIELEEFKIVVSIFKDLNMDKRDELLLRDTARNRFLLMNGNERELPLLTKQYSVSRRLQEMYDLTGKKVANLYQQLGKRLASVYRDVHKTDPPKNESFVNGAVRMVNCYFSDFWDDYGDKILEEVYSDFLEDDTSIEIEIED